MFDCQQTTEDGGQHMTYKPSKLGQADLVTALHVMQTRYSEENSVRLSVCLSVRHTRDP